MPDDDDEPHRPLGTVCPQCNELHDHFVSCRGLKAYKNPYAPKRGFPPGVSGNPSGRKKHVREALEKFQDPGDLEMLRLRLLDLALDKDPKVSVPAIKEYHDRAFGKAPVAVSVGGEDGKPIAFDLLPMLQRLVIGQPKIDVQPVDALPPADEPDEE
jgi:hypothetical protein